MSTVGDVMQTLMDMGFSEGKVKVALAETSWKGVEPAMEWLLAHADDSEPVPEPEPVPTETPDSPDASLNPSESSSSSDVKPIILTEEEKKEKLRKLEELRILKRKEREEKEKASEIEKEKKRISEGKMLSSIRKSHEDMEMKKIAEERRREKLETQRAKERVRAQIEEDKQARREAEERRRNPQGATTPSVAASNPSVTTSQATATEYSQTRIQIRLPNGSTLVQTFSAKEPLSAVRLFVSMNRKDNASDSPCKFMTSFPRKIFSEEDFQKPLESLELVPSAVLIVTK